MIHETPPKGFSPRFDVVAVLMEYVPTNSVLFLHRHPDKPQGGTWCLPGGKMDDADNGNLRRALVREVLEEIQVVIGEDDLKFVASIPVTHDAENGGYSFWYHVFRYPLPVSTPKDLPNIILGAHEHVAHAWWPMSEVLRSRNLQEVLIPDELPCLRKAYSLIAAKNN